MTSNKKGFTLIEMLVVVAMIAAILGAMSMSFSGAQERARIQKATGEVKIITQAVLAYENYARGGEYKLEPMSDAECNASSLGFLLGRGESADTGGRIPAMLMAALSGGGAMRDPWGTPYRITIKQGDASVKIESASGSMQTGYQLPNFYRLAEGERK